MARIRTIKPEFWTDGTLMECSLNARLLFIGTWNFADDFGNLERSAKQLKARIFPADLIDCEPLIQELIAQELLVEYQDEGKKFLHIPGFKKHQVINRPGKPQCPLYADSKRTHGAVSECSVSDHGSFTTGREGKGKEGKGKDSSPQPPLPPAREKAAAGREGAAPVKDTFDRVDEALRQIPGLKDHPLATDPVIGPIVQLVEKGLDLRTQIVPSITRQIQNAKRPIKRWSFFVPGIEEDASEPQGTRLVASNDTIVAEWPQRMEYARKVRQWPSKWGPWPNTPGCLVPAELLLPDDGDGWTEWKAAS